MYRLRPVRNALTTCVVRGRSLWRALLGRVPQAAVAFGVPVLAPGGIGPRLEAERERWFLWVPVVFGAGIGGYFALPFEPQLFLLILIFIAAGALRYAFRRETWAPVLTGVLLCLSTGFLAAKVRTEATRAPVLWRAMDARMVAGVLEAKEPRRKSGYRMTLRTLAVQGLTHRDVPQRVRFIWNGETDIAVGEALTVRLSLKPPPTPVRPGGYDFSRRAWFQQIGAVGFAVSRPVRSGRVAQKHVDEQWVLARLVHGVVSRIENLRSRIGARIQDRIPGERGAIINALIIGQRGNVTEPTLEHLRRAGLSHMLAISGLHMAMIAGALFWLIRVGLAAVPVLALNRAIKKGAAAVALCGGLGYLAISGASVATQRASIMIGLMLVAVLLDRPAISQRNVALAALLILLMRPENILEIGFQMSFAAVVALVAFYEWWRLREDRRDAQMHGYAIGGQHQQFAPLNMSPVAIGYRAGRNMIVGTLVTTIVAGVAVAPLGAFHFHQVAHYSLLANLLAMPVFTTVVMPMALVTLLTLPLGLEGPGLSVMAWGIEQVTSVAAWVSDKPYAVQHTAAMSSWAFLMMIAGGLWLCLWQRRWRFAGVVPIVAGIVMSADPPRPDLLVAREGALVAVRSDGGSLSGSPGRVGTFELTRWMEADGDARADAPPKRGDGFVCDRSGCVTRIGNVLVAMPGSPATLAEDCRRATIVVLTFPQLRPCSSARLVIDRDAVQRMGVHAVTIGQGGDIRVRTVEGQRGDRPWTLVAQRRAREAAKLTAAAEANAGRMSTGDGAVVGTEKNRPSFE